MQANQLSPTPALSVKRQTVNIFSFAGHKVCVYMQLCLVAGKQLQPVGKQVGIAVKWLEG